MTSEEYQSKIAELKKFFKEGDYESKISGKLFDVKEEFFKIFDVAIKRDNGFLNCDGKISHDELINMHLNAWICSRINGISASMAFYAEESDAIILIDNIMKKNFPILQNERVRLLSE